MCLSLLFPYVLFFAGVFVFRLLSVLNILQTEGKSTEQEAFPLDINDFVWFLGQKRRQILCLNEGGTTQFSKRFTQAHHSQLEADGSQKLCLIKMVRVTLVNFFP